MYFRKSSVICLSALTLSIFVFSLTYYIHFQNSHPIKAIENKELQMCVGHVSLCWLRFMIENVLGQRLLKKLFDLSPLYEYSTGMFLDEDFSIFRKDNHLKDGEYYLKLIRHEAVLNGLTYPNPNLMIGVDIYGRGCDYNPHSEYKYIIEKRQNSNSVIIYLTEIALNNRTHNKFTPNYLQGVIKTNSTVNACEVKEYFPENSTYFLKCAMLQPVFTITLKMYYISIATSNFICQNATVWNFSTISSDDFPKQPWQIPKHGIHKYKSGFKMCKNANGHSLGFWQKVGSIFHWATKTCYFPFIFTKDTLHCLQSTDILFIGDSHMEQRYRRMKAIYNIKTLSFNKSRHSLHNLNVLLRILNKFQKKQRPADVLVINSGAHDLRFLDIVTYIATMDNIFKVVKNLLHLDNPPRIIWVETTPTHPSQFHGKMMTNQMVDAVNDWVNYHMGTLGVPIVHAFDITITMTSQNMGDNNHFSTVLGGRIRTFNKVSVGGAVTSVIVTTICQNPDIKDFHVDKTIPT